MPTIDSDFLALGLIWYLVFLFSTVCHEAAHALVAQLGGDETAAQGGQVGLDPMPHIQREPLGMVLVPLVSYFMNGWMMGWASAPYDPYWADRHPHRAARMAAAGPVANFILMGVAAIAIKVGVAQGWLSAPQMANFSTIVLQHGDKTALSMILSVMFTLNLVLGCFNLLPLPPLDGSGAIGLFMPEDTARRWHGFIRQPNFAMIGMLLAWGLFGKLFSPIFTLALNLLYPGSHYG